MVHATCDVTVVPAVELGTQSRIRAFAQSIAAATRLPHVPLAAWGSRAAACLCAGFESRAATLTIVDRQSAAVLHAGAACSPPMQSAQPALYAAAISLWSNTGPTGTPGPDQVPWARTDLHPFARAGLSPGSVIRTVRLITPRACLVAFIWQRESDSDETDMDATSITMDYIADAARSLACPGSGQLHWLTPKESEIAELVAMGNTIDEIAILVRRSSHTVHDHVKAIHRKAGVTTRGELVAAVNGRRDGSQWSAHQETNVHSLQST